MELQESLLSFSLSFCGLLRKYQKPDSLGPISFNDFQLDLSGQIFFSLYLNEYKVLLRHLISLTKRVKSKVEV